MPEERIGNSMPKVEATASCRSERVAGEGISTSREASWKLTLIVRSVVIVLRVPVLELLLSLLLVVFIMVVARWGGRSVLMLQML